MKYTDPIIETLSVSDNGTTYTIKCYKPFISISGVVDEAYPNYGPLITYNTGEYVIIPELHRIYRCGADGVAGVFPLADKSVWTDYGFVNSYRMFSIDEGIGAVTTGTDIVMEFDFDQMDTLGITDIEFSSLTLEQINKDTLESVSYEISGRDIGCLSLGEYFYSDATEVTRVIMNNLEWLPSSKIKLTFTGLVECGSFTLGNYENFGFTLYGTSLEFEDKSLIAENNLDNTRDVLRYGHIQILTAKLNFEIDEFNATAQKISRMIGKNILFIPTELDDFNEMNNIAYIERIKLPVDNDVSIETEITLIGVIKK